MSDMVVEQFPVMKGDAVMARGASYFEVPLFSHIIDNLWMGCSPAEFPDELEPYGYDFIPAVVRGLTVKEPVNCRWLFSGEITQEVIHVPPVFIPGIKDFPARFDKIFNLFRWGQYVAPVETEVEIFEMFDGEKVDEYMVRIVVDGVITALNDGKRVLVHCQAGLNRSSLAVARVLMLQYGMTADQAIEHIREKRSPMCLCNESFTDWLRSLDDK